MLPHGFVLGKDTLICNRAHSITTLHQALSHLPLRHDREQAQRVSVLGTDEVDPDVLLSIHMSESLFGCSGLSESFSGYFGTSSVPVLSNVCFSFRLIDLEELSPCSSLTNTLGSEVRVHN